MKEIKAFASPNQDVIERLEELLDQAKSGELRGIVYATRTTGNRTGSGWANIDDGVMALIGELIVLQRDFLDSMVDLRINPKTGEEL